MWLVGYTAVRSSRKHMLSVRRDLVLALDSPWTAMSPLRLGKIPAGLGTADLFLTISEDDRPLLRVDLYADCSGPFQAVVWSEHVFVGVERLVYVIDPKRAFASEIFLDSDAWGYFGHFYPDHEYLLVASATALLRLAPDGNVLWNRSDLGLDGVVVNSVEDGLIKGEGCWDLDEEWKPFLLRLDSGELIIG